VPMQAQPSLSQPAGCTTEATVSNHQRVSDNMLLLLIGATVVLFHILTNGQYGFYRDELDILLNARQLDWGYVAYPPFTPFIARIGLTLFGSSLVGLRLFPAVAQGIVVILSGLMARDFGGGRWAQATAAVAAHTTLPRHIPCCWQPVRPGWEAGSNRFPAAEPCGFGPDWLRSSLLERYWLSYPASRSCLPARRSGTRQWT
jgi:hypothetical protein